MQMFPGNSVRVLGVDIGRHGRRAGPRFRGGHVPDRRPGSKLPPTSTPRSSRYLFWASAYAQLFPAYDGGDEFTSDHLAMEHTSVPTEQDELLRGLQDYFGALDPARVAAFVTDVASVLDKNGQNLNDFINYGSGVIATLSREARQPGEDVPGAEHDHPGTRHGGKDRRLIHSYNSVTKIVNENRTAVEGTIEGLNLAAAELASLSIDHRDPLGADVRTLTERLGRSTATSTASTHRALGQRLFGAAASCGRLQGRLAAALEPGRTARGDGVVPAARPPRRGVPRLELDDCEGDFLEEQLPYLFCQILKDCDQPKPSTKQQQQQQLRPATAHVRNPRGGARGIAQGPPRRRRPIGKKVRKKLGLKEELRQRPLSEEVSQVETAFEGCRG